MKKFIPTLFFTIFVVTVSYAQSPDSLIVSPEHPVRLIDTALRKKLLQWSIATLTPNKLYVPHPSSVIFPGKVKSGFELKDTVFHFIHKQADTAQYNIFKKFPAAHPNKGTLYSTGLYAVPGQPVYVTLSPELYSREIYLVIGAHLDYLGFADANNEDWRRMPCVAAGFLLDSSFRFVSSHFGGLIYLFVGAEKPFVETQLTFKNVITAPYYKSGSTTAADWKKQLATNKAPWGEIASDKVIITLPDSALQKIEDPEKILAVWDKIVSTEAELAQLPSPFIRPVRMVVDEQISAGYMHAGYPIMIHHSPSTGMLSLNVITNPQKLLLPSDGGANWGFFHEIGHTLQNEEWTFDGTREVTCNLFGLYVFDSLIKTRKGAHGNIEDAYQKKNLMQKFFANGATYKAYQEDAFLALIPFMQLQKQFGWTPFKKVFKYYLDHPSYDFDVVDNTDSSRRKANQLKIDRFVERFSTETKTNLIPFFRAWGIPVSEIANERLRNYKTWLPEDLKEFVKMH